MKKRAIICVALAGAVCASAAIAETIYVQAESTNLLTGPGGEYPMVCSLDKGQQLTVLAHEDDWLKVQAQSSSTTQPTSVEGFVFKDSLSPDQPMGIDMLTNKIHMSNTVSEGAAGKGLSPEATKYADAKSLNPKPLNDLIAFRQTKISPSEVQAFFAAGNVGTAYKKK